MATTDFPRMAVLLATLAVAGCGGDDLSRSFGLQRDAPDEFEVTTRAPLSIPPDFTLRPPEPGAPRPQEQTPTQSAEAALAPQTVLAPQPTSGADSPGQDALLAAAGAPPPADIRAKVEAEAAKGGDDALLTDKLMFWKNPVPGGTVVDAQKEADRLHANAALGQSPDVGDTPMIKPKHENIIDSLWPF